jgi:hypothetical protein
MDYEYYCHGSITEIGVDQSLLHPGEESYTNLDETKWIEEFMEKHRVEGCLSRFESVFMADNSEDIDNLGGYTDFIYIVRPVDGYAEKSDLSWYTKASMLIGDYPSKDIPEHILDQAKGYAENYWSGKSSENPVWEYRCLEAAIVTELDEDQDFKSESFCARTLVGINHVSGGNDLEFTCDQGKVEVLPESIPNHFKH